MVRYTSFIFAKMPKKAFLYFLTLPDDTILASIIVTPAIA